MRLQFHTGSAAQSALLASVQFQHPHTLLQCLTSQHQSCHRKFNPYSLNALDEGVEFQRLKFSWQPCAGGLHGRARAFPLPFPRAGPLIGGAPPRVRSAFAKRSPACQAGRGLNGAPQSSWRPCSGGCQGRAEIPSFNTKVLSDFAIGKAKRKNPNIALATFKAASA